ncbi:MAG: hypothetical protein ACREDK_01640 [Thermoplasmata archaeon]
MRSMASQPALVGILVVAITLGGAAAFLAVPASATAHLTISAKSGPSTLPGTTFVSAPPGGASGPDDLAYLPPQCTFGIPGTIWTAYQNGIGPTGTPSGSGATASTIVGYDVGTGAVVLSVNVSGHVDGLTADPAWDKLIATTNEDANSSLVIIDPVTGGTVSFAYSPSPTVSGNGGTDSIAIWHGGIFVSHSNPSDTTQPTTYRASLDWASHVAALTPLYWDDSTARNGVSGSMQTLALTDPDTNYVMPRSSPRFAGDLATISQGDGAIVFASNGGGHATHLAVLNVTDNASGNVPPIDGLSVATSAAGILYVVDSSAGTIQMLRTHGWPAGTVFVSEPHDNGNPLLGTLDLTSGVISPLGNAFHSPKGLLFLPASSDHQDLAGGCAHAHHDDRDSGSDAPRGVEMAPGIPTAPGARSSD